MKLRKRQDMDLGITLRELSLTVSGRKAAFMVASDPFEPRSLTANRVIHADRKSVV